jgi:hypothetical protein
MFKNCPHLISYNRAYVDGFMPVDVLQRLVCENNLPAGARVFYAPIDYTTRRQPDTPLRELLAGGAESSPLVPDVFDLTFALNKTTGEKAVSTKQHQTIDPCILINTPRATFTALSNVNASYVFIAGGFETNLLTNVLSWLRLGGQKPIEPTTPPPDFSTAKTFADVCQAMMDWGMDEHPWGGGPSSYDGAEVAQVPDLVEINRLGFLTIDGQPPKIDDDSQYHIFYINHMIETKKASASFFEP